MTLHCLLFGHAWDEIRCFHSSLGVVPPAILKRCMRCGSHRRLLS